MYSRNDNDKLCVYADIQVASVTADWLWRADRNSTV